MGFLNSDIEVYSEKIKQLEYAKAQIDSLGLEPGIPAICRITKKVLLLKNQVEVVLKKNKDTNETSIFARIVGFDGQGKAEWYDAVNLVPYTEASRILYLK